MPGVPMGGHSIAGSISRGVWTRLYARAVYLEDAEGRALVLVSCDLWSIPGGLADRVAEKVLRSNGGKHIGREQIVLAATHTHHSPGNYSTSEFYNKYSSPGAGFDGALFNFLADRITEAVLSAAQDKKPATFSFAEQKADGLVRNRSLDAFLLNPESRGIIVANSSLTAGPITDEFCHPDAYRAVNSSISVLKITREDKPDETMALLGFVAAHPTALGHETEVYQADFFGVAATLFERRLMKKGTQPKEPVVALFNGAEGDVSTCWEAHQDRRSVLKMGELLAANLHQLADKAQPLPNRPRINYRFARRKLAGREFHDRAGVVRRTSGQPLTGVGMVGGAEDGRTEFADAGFREGVRGRRILGHGAKQPAFDPKFIELPISLTRLLINLNPPPHEVPLGVYSLGPIVFATLPGEFTTVMGLRIAEGISKKCGFQPQKVLLIGLANEYVSYFATPEEYDAQHYEGASTLYGPASGPLVQHDLEELAQQLNSPPTHAPASGYSYSTGTPHRFWPGNIGESPYRYDDGLANILQDLNDGCPVRDFPHFEWDEAKAGSGSTAARTIPHVSIETRDPVAGWKPLDHANGGIEDNEGVNIVTLLLKVRPNSNRWCAVWMPDQTPALSGSYRFKVILPNSAQELHSKSFTLNNLK